MPTEASSRNYVSLALRLVLGGLLAYAAVQKLLEPAAFVEQVANYQWFPEAAVLVAALLPPMELVAALALWVLGAHWRQAAALLAAGLFAVFTVAVTRAVWLDINVDCGCFGEGSGEIGPLTIARNLALTGSALWLAYLSRARMTQAG